ncbi:MAG: hypothetical protein AAF483_11450, partial [Planctomycetota bacterium]
IASGEFQDGVELEYRLQKGQMPSGRLPVAKLYWSESPYVLDGAVPAYEEELSWDPRDGKLAVRPGILGRTWRGEAFLVATIEMPADISRTEYRVRRKYVSAAANDGVVNSALGFKAPAPARIKVASWLSEHERVIRSTAKKFRIAPEALASAITYQALARADKKSGLVDLFDYDAIAVEATTKYSRGFISPKPEAERGQSIDAVESIQYIAGIMGGYSFEAKRRGFPIRQDAGQLVSLFTNRLRRGTREAPESLYTGISPSFLPRGGQFYRSSEPVEFGNPLYTEHVAEAGDTVEVYSWEQRAFQRNEETFVLTHGFNSAASAWPIGVAKALRLRFPSSNILLVDWSRIAAAPLYNYAQPAGLVNDVGREVGEWLGAERGLNVDPEKLHFIGHSLGAHVSGAAASAVRKQTGVRVRQVTGLDTAGPLFGKWFGGVSRQERLDTTDADRVVAVHTTSFFLGYHSDLGHLDLHVNHGTAVQPGESIVMGPILGNHGYATELMRLLIAGQRFTQGSHDTPVGSFLDWQDIMQTNGYAGVSTEDILDSGFGVFVSPEHLLVRGKVDTSLEYEFAGLSQSLRGAGPTRVEPFKLAVRNARVIRKGDSVVSLLRFERPVAGVQPIAVTGRSITKAFPGLSIPSRIAREVREAVAKHANRSGYVNLGTVSYHFKRLQETGKRLQPNRQIASWVQTQSSFIADALTRSNRRTSRLVRGDINDDLDVDQRDQVALRNLVSRIRSMTAEERREALAIGDLNDDQILDDHDLELVQKRILSEQSTFQANDDQVSVVRGVRTRIDVVQNDIASNKAAASIVWTDQANNGTLELIDGAIHYQPNGALLERTRSGTQSSQRMGG